MRGTRRALGLLLFLPLVVCPVAAGVSGPVADRAEPIGAALVARVVPAWVDPLVRLTAPDAAPQPVVLVLDPALERATLDALEGLGLATRHYDHLGMAAAVLPPALVDVVASLPGIVSVHGNERMDALLDRSVAYVGADIVHRTYHVTGRGVTVMVMDSGVDGSHPDVRYGAKLLENVVPTRTANGLVGGSREGVVASDSDGHGTHVAAIVAGDGVALGSASAKYRGVAPGARLVGYQAGLTDPDTGDIRFESLTVLEGYNWALANRDRFGIRVVTNSWGANGEFDPRSPVNLATLNLYKAGILVVFAAGNEGRSGPGNMNKYSLAPWVLSVTAGDYLNEIPDFASRGSDDPDRPYERPDIVAPGASITSAKGVQGRSVPGDAGTAWYYATKGGTSMATPHVAGAAALLLEANPRLSPDDVMDILTATATPMPRYGVHEAGAGYLNVLKALHLAERTAGDLDAFLGGHVKYAGAASGDPAHARDAVSVGYQRGTAHRLRSGEPSLGAWARDLVATGPGLVFLVGSAGILGTALAPGRAQPARARPAPVDAPSPGASSPVPAWAPTRVRPPGPAVARPRETPLAGGGRVTGRARPVTARGGPSAVAPRVARLRPSRASVPPPTRLQVPRASASGAGRSGRPHARPA